MAGSGSSSKRKLSKRKSVKISSQKKKKKSRKESKKRRRDYDSVSSYSDDESQRSSSPTSKAGYKKRTNKHKKLHRARSISSYSDDQSINSDSDSRSTHDSSYKNKKVKRSRIKSTKARTKKRHDSPDSDAKANKNVRKKKESGRDRVVKPPKKSSKKKKSKKHYSSSSSSYSESLYSSSSSGDRKRKRSKITLDKEIDRPRGSYKKRKTRSPSCSSRGTGVDHSVSVDHSDDVLAPVNNSKRLRSVITFVDRFHDEGENKEEIVYDYDDYPSPKSMDTIEEGNKRELDDNSRGVFDDEIREENVVGEKITELGKSGINEDDQKNVDVNKLEKEKDGLGGDDLESILRQKALENLRKFRGGFQKTNNGSDVNDSSPRKVDIIIQTKSTNRSSSSAGEINQSGGPTLEIDSSRVDTEKFPNSGHVEQEPGIDEEAIDHAPGGTALVALLEEDKGKAKRVIGNDTSSGSGAINARSSSTMKPTSSVGPIYEGQSLEEQQNETKDGEFKQKTMSVMRGGEMVQVSYKVYIPKKAPALARRQLRR